jgi:Arc/MetJ family transcription regulator
MKWNVRPQVLNAASESPQVAGKRIGPLTRMHRKCILMHMRTTVILDEELLDRAKRMTGIQQTTALVRAGLDSLITREAAKRLTALGGTEPRLGSIPRRRPEYQ